MPTGASPIWSLDRPFFDEGTLPENVLLAHQGERVLGYVKLRPSAMLASRGHVQEIHGLAVAAAYQGHGIGRRLLAAARQEAIRRGSRRVTLRVLGTNTRAIAVYRAAGYRVEGVLEGQFLIEGRYVDDVHMALTLTAPNSAAAGVRDDRARLSGGPRPCSAEMTLGLRSSDLFPYLSRHHASSCLWADRHCHCYDGGLAGQGRSRRLARRSDGSR
ncbi:hypothetical protein GCM10027589_38780 [Actinocorallia lasiicapitis]